LREKTSQVSTELPLWASGAGLESEDGVNW